MKWNIKAFKVSNCFLFADGKKKMLKRNEKMFSLPFQIAIFNCSLLSPIQCIC